MRDPISDHEHVFRTDFVDRERFFALEYDEATARCFVSFPVSNQLVDYIEHYEVDRATYDGFLADPASAHGFVSECKRHEHDDLLLHPPGRDRGEPWGM